MPKKQTSDRVSKIAARVMRGPLTILRIRGKQYALVELGELRALAGSALSQDEVRGPRPRRSPTSRR